MPINFDRGKATIDLDVEVTQGDHEYGVQNNCHRCPVARAVNRALDKEGWSHIRAEVYPTNVYLVDEAANAAGYRKTRWYDLGIPEGFTSYIVDYDDGGRCSPLPRGLFTFASGT